VGEGGCKPYQKVVIPAKAGTQFSFSPRRESWVPAFAGMTDLFKVDGRDKPGHDALFADGAAG
jgi:hypothetical protein